MTLAHVRVRSFRNLSQVALEPGPGVNVLFGENAQGKTNLIEALYVLANLQSFRTRRLRDLVLFGSNRARVEGEVRGRRGTVRLRVEVGPEGRNATCDGAPPASVADYLSELHTVLFTPLDLDLARGNQELRRRFADRATFLADPTHLGTLRDYNRALRQRNALLRSGQAGIDAWDERLASLGGAVHRARGETLRRLEPFVAAIHGEISGGREEVTVELARGGGEGGGEDADDLLTRLRRWRLRDVQRGYTTVGPHRDAVVIRLGGNRVDRFGSQGQLRTLALSLKLALLRWGSEVLGAAPLFLLDDPGSELDQGRLGFLGAFLSRWEGQVVIAGTHRDAVPLPPEGGCRYYRVTAGRIRPE